jgi:hypothetical protein
LSISMCDSPEVARKGKVYMNAYIKHWLKGWMELR